MRPELKPDPAGGTHMHAHTIYPRYIHTYIPRYMLQAVSRLDVF